MLDALLNLVTVTVTQGTAGHHAGGSIPGADVGDVGLATHQYFGAAKVTQLELMRLRVDQQVLGFDVSMTDLHAVDVRQRPAHLQKQARRFNSKCLTGFKLNSVATILL